MAVRSRTVRARKLRQNATEPERILWRALREMSLPVNVRRQHPVGRYVADFAIPACKLIIELDGSQHATNVEADSQRTEELNELGYRVIRIWNTDVIDNLEGVVRMLVAEIDQPPTSP